MAEESTRSDDMSIQSTCLKRKRWAIMWHSKHPKESHNNYLMWDHGPTPLLFRTRREAREYRNERWGYIRDRKDLRVAPHWWRLPRVVRVEMEVTVIS